MSYTPDPLTKRRRTNDFEVTADMTVRHVDGARTIRFHIFGDETSKHINARILVHENTALDYRVNQIA